MEGKINTQTVQLHQETVTLSKDFSGGEHFVNFEPKVEVKSLKDLQQDVDKNPKDSFAFYRLGCHHYDRGQLEESVDCLTKAIALNPSKAMQHAAEVKLKANRISKAIKDALAVSHEDTEGQGLKLLAAASHLDEDNEKIQQQIRDARNVIIGKMATTLQTEIEIGIGRKMKTIKIAKTSKFLKKLLQDGKIAEIEAALDQECEEVKDSEEIKFIQAKVFYVKGLLKEAIPLLRAVLTLNSNHADANKLLKLASEIDELTEAAAQRTTEKEYEKTIEILTKVLSVDPENKQILQAAYFQRSLAHFSLLNTAEAFNDFKKFENLQNSAPSEE